MSNRAAIYARVSTDEQGYGYSLPTQIEGCQTYANERGYHVIGTFSDEFTGTLLDRPELDRIRELGEAHLIDRIVVYDLDRFARGLAKQIILEEEFKRSGICLDIVLAEYEDSPEGKLQKNVRAVIAEYEREKFLERSSRGKKGRLKAGHVIPSAVAPYGFRYVSLNDGHGGTYEIIDDEAKIVRWIFEWSVFGDETGRRLGAPSIARKLTEMGISTRYDTMAHRHNKKGKRGQWNVKTVTDMLGSELYIGIYYWGKTALSNGKRGAKDKSKWIPISIPAIITRELWEAAQQQKLVNKSRSLRNTKGEYLLQGHLRCARCGRSCKIQSNRGTGRQARYRCGLTSVAKDLATGHICNESILQPMTDQLVWNAVRQILDTLSR